MPDNDSLTSEEQQLKHRHEHVEPVQVGEQAQASVIDTLPLGPSLLLDPNIGGRGNAPVRTATVQRMQEAYGNRATRRYLQRHSAKGATSEDMLVQRVTASTAGIAVQRNANEEDEEQEQPVQRMAATGATVSVQRHPVKQQDEEDEQQRPVPVQKKPANGAAVAVQREGGDQAAQGAQGAQGQQQPPGSSSAGAAPQAGDQTQPVRPGNLILDDGAKDVQPGQMHRSEFMSQLRGAVNAAVDSVLSGTPYADMAAPQVQEQFAQYQGMDSHTLEQSILRQVPGAGGAHTAGEYIPMVAQTVRDKVKEQIPKDPISNALAEGAAVIGSIAQGIGNAVSSIGSAISSVFFKGRDGGPKQADATSIQRQLNSSGQTLPSDTRSGLEAAFGADLSGVRLHTDTGASQLSDNLNARAFTVGQDIAFGSGEYQPGTAVGDALIAHEVAHVVQQGNGRAGGDGVMQKGGDGGDSALEEEADTSAVRALVSMWSGARSGLANVGQNAMPVMRTGLRLQRCSSKPKLTEDEAKRLETIKNNVKGTGQGAHAIEVVNTYNVGVGFGSSGAGSFFSPDSNNITLDPGQSDIDLGFVYIHEANHAEYKNKKMTADISKNSREDYVNKMLDEETEGTALQIEAKVELEASPGGVDIGSASTQPGETSYKKGYKAEYDKAKAAGKSEDEAKAAGRVGGKALLRKDFEEGLTIVTSTTHEPYKTYYGKAWDKAHA